MGQNNTSSNMEPGRLSLSGNQDVRTVGELQRSLTELLSKNNGVIVDCNAVDSLDAAFLQVLLAAKREAPDLVQITANSDSEAARWIHFAGLTQSLLGTSTTTSLGA